MGNRIRLGIRPQGASFALRLACLISMSICVASTAAATTPTPVTPTPCPPATPEPLWVEPLTSPTSASSQVIVVHNSNFDWIEVTSESGTFRADEADRVVISLLPDTIHHLEVTVHVRKITNPSGCMYGNYSLRTTRDRHGGPLTIAQQRDGPTPTPTPTPPLMSVCVGDCSADGEVDVDELITGINVMLGAEALANCPAFDANNDDSVTVEELVAAIEAAMNGSRLGSRRPTSNAESVRLRAPRRLCAKRTGRQMQGVGAFPAQRFATASRAAAYAGLGSRAALNSNGR